MIEVALDGPDESDQTEVGNELFTHCGGKVGNKVPCRPYAELFLD